MNSSFRLPGALGRNWPRVGLDARPHPAKLKPSPVKVGPTSADVRPVCRPSFCPSACATSSAIPAMFGRLSSQISPGSADAVKFRFGRCRSKLAQLWPMFAYILAKRCLYFADSGRLWPTLVDIGLRCAEFGRILVTIRQLCADFGRSRLLVPVSAESQAISADEKKRLASQDFAKAPFRNPD